MYLLSGDEGTWERASGENSGASEPIGGDILVHDWEVRDGPNSTEHTQHESERDKPNGGVSLHDDLTAKKKRESALKVEMVKLFSRFLYVYHFMHQEEKAVEPRGIFASSNLHLSKLEPLPWNGRDKRPR